MAAIFLCTAFHAIAAQVPHEVYVWQRQWTPELRSAIRDSADVFPGVRVLVAQAGRDGRLHATQADSIALAGVARTRVAVIRYDGIGVAPDVSTLAAWIADLAQRWQAAGAPLAGVEIDYDCATARLADYAARLRTLRAALPAAMKLSITALPSWQHAAALDDVLAATDQAVLQVHSVQSPAHGLFDAALAERWIRAFAPHALHGFLVALPAYGMRVRFDGEGRAVAVESEMTVDAASDAHASEFRVDAADVAALLRRLGEDAPPNWRGVAWFRLPLPGDQRAWTIAALRSVIEGRVPAPALAAEIIADGNGATDVLVANTGAVDARASSVRISGRGCSAGDAAAGWRGESIADGWRFLPDTTLRVRANTRRAVGWVRCAVVTAAHIEQGNDER